MLTKAVIRPPAPNFFEGLTTAGQGAPDYEPALKQHGLYCAALERCGLKLMRLNADPNYPDSTFVEDTAVLVPLAEKKTQTRTQLVMTRPGAPSRRGEVESVRSTLVELASSSYEIESPGTLDGGDVCEAAMHFFIGISERTNEAGAQQLAELLARHSYTSKFIDIRNSGALLHLKSGLAYLGDNRLVVTGALADRADFHRYDLVRVNLDEEYAANCVRVNEQVLVAAGYPKFENRLRELGYQTIALEMSEFQKMDGGLSCLSLRF